MKGDKLCVATAVFILLFLIIGSFCYVLIPDNTEFAGRKCIPIGNQPPGFEVKMLRMVNNRPPEPQTFLSRIFQGVRSNETLIPITSSNYEGTDIVVREFSASGDSSFVSRFNIADVVYAVNLEKKIIERNGGLFFETAYGAAVEESISDLQAIIDGQNLVGKKFLLGTDRYGRDVLSRLVAATRATVFTAIFATTLSLVAGLFFGLLAGLLRSRVKIFISWLMRSLASFPGMLLLGALMFTFGNGFFELFIAAACVLWVQVASVVLSRITAVQKQKFIQSAEALGLSKLQILKTHILPELVKPLIACCATIFCAAVMMESGMSFLGIGLREPDPSWGAMIRENYGYIFVTGQEYKTLLPGFAILLVSFAFVFLSYRLHALLQENDRRVLV